LDGAGPTVTHGVIVAVPPPRAIPAGGAGAAVAPIVTVVATGAGAWRDITERPHFDWQSGDGAGPSGGPSAEAVKVAVPTARPLTRPGLLEPMVCTVAIEVLLLDQWVEEVWSTTLPSDKVNVKVACCVPLKGVVVGFGSRFASVVV